VISVHGTPRALDTPEFAKALGLAALIHRTRVHSTMDDAHALALKGAPAGTLVVADQQTGGRGRGGKQWTSGAASGLWMTLLERPADVQAVEVLALRLGLTLADALDAFTDAPVRLKWPNDLYVGTGKLAGILVEARWRESLVDWVAIGVGLNFRAPDDIPDAASVRQDVSRDAVLRAVIPAMRRAAQASGPLTESELSAWDARDLVKGRRLAAPRAGVAAGITAMGTLLIVDQEGVQYHVRSGSLIFA